MGNRSYEQDSNKGSSPGDIRLPVKACRPPYRRLPLHLYCLRSRDYVSIHEHGRVNSSLATRSKEQDRFPKPTMVGELTPNVLCDACAWLKLYSAFSSFRPSGCIEIHSSPRPVKATTTNHDPDRAPLEPESVRRKQDSWLKRDSGVHP